jgi:predicted Holliday junction resolvase-like endonuclease
MITEQLIKKLGESNLYAECRCGGEFKLSRSILFDGTKPFPEKALEIQKRLKEELKAREDELKKRRKLATKKAQITTKAVNIGKNLEKVLPTMRDFKWTIPDSKFLGDPIDLIIFNGLSVSKVKSIDFIEVKSGKARLNNHQKAIRDAIEEQKVSYKVFE